MSGRPWVVKQQTTASAIKDIETIASLERELLDDRSLIERVGDAIGGFVGTMGFVILHVAGFASWAILNLNVIPGIRPFDPYPFMLLSMVVSLEGVLLTTFVLMKQNRMSRRTEHRNQLNLQIDLLAEKEITKILQMLRAMCDHMGLQEQAAEPELKEMSQKTEVDQLARDLREKMPEE